MTLPRSSASGFRAALRSLLAPFGPRVATYHHRLRTRERYERGLIIVLPGIDGCTTLCDNIARGVEDCGGGLAIELLDWRASRHWSPRHLRTIVHHQQQAERIAGRIRAYRDEHADGPVHLIGYSAGAGMALRILTRLDARVPVDGVILLSAAVSHDFPVMALANRTRDGIWNFWSPWDFPVLGTGTLCFGTLDRRKGVSAGCRGFLLPPESPDLPGPVVRNIRYSWPMARSWNFGGHFGMTNTAFVRRHVAPLLNRSRGDDAAISRKVHQMLAGNKDSAVTLPDDSQVRDTVLVSR
jgi:pimeloyl-ACP methyl ester carboxylesterase